MGRYSEGDRAIVLPTDINIPDAYILGYTEAIDEFLEDLRSLGHKDVYYPTIKEQIIYHIKKWEAKKNE